MDVASRNEEGNLISQVGSRRSKVNGIFKRNALRYLF